MPFTKQLHMFRKSGIIPQEDAEETTILDPYAYASGTDKIMNPNLGARSGGEKPTFYDRGADASKLKPTDTFKETNVPTFGKEMLVTQMTLSIRTQLAGGGFPMLIYGDPGIGKSDITRDTAKNIATRVGRKFAKFSDIVGNFDQFMSGSGETNVKNTFVLFDMRASEYLPEDIKGIPDIHSAKEYLTFKSPAWVHWCTAPDAAGILFFDELNRGITPTLNALLQITLDRVIVDRPLAPGIAMIGAANLGASFVGTNELDPALYNRFKHGAFVPDPASWIKFAREARIHPDIIDFVQINAAGTSDDEKDAAGHFNVFYQVPKENVIVYATPRSIVNFSKEFRLAIEDYDVELEELQQQGDFDKEDERDLINKYLQIVNAAAEATVGRDWAAAFAVFISSRMSVNIDTLYIQTRTQDLSDALVDSKKRIMVSQVNAAGINIARTAVYSLKPEVRYTYAGLSALSKCGAVIARTHPETIRQIIEEINLNVSLPKNMSRIVAGTGKIGTPYQYLSAFVGGERVRFKALKAAAAQLNLKNDDQINGFINSLYINSKLPQQELDANTTKLKEYLAKNKNKGDDAFTKLNDENPGVMSEEGLNGWEIGFKKFAHTKAATDERKQQQSAGATNFDQMPNAYIKI